MGLRFRKSVKIAPGVRLNIGKKSVGVSAGVKGYRKSINSSGRVTTSIGTPVAGVSYVKTENLKSKKKKAASNRASSTAAAASSSASSPAVAPAPVKVQKSSCAAKREAAKDHGSFAGKTRRQLCCVRRRCSGWCRVPLCFFSCYFFRCRCSVRRLLSV